MSFWLICALMLLAALAWLLLPLLRTRAHTGQTQDAANVAVYRAQLAELDAERAAGTLDTARYEEAKRALVQRLALDVDSEARAAQPVGRAQHSVLAAVMLAALLPLAVIGLYLQWGNPQALGVGARDAAAQRELEQMTPERIEDMVKKLEDHLRGNPHDAKGWSVLARTYRGLGKLPQAQQAFERALSLAPNDAGLHVDFAELLGAQANGDLRGRAADLLETALKLEPAHPEALALGGSAAEQRGDIALALARWEQLLKLLPAQAEVRPLLEQRIAGLREGGGARVQQSEKTAQAASARKLSVKVSLAAALASKVSAQDSVFVFARAAQGPKMPLAVARAKAGELPREFSLSDADAMTPAMALSKFDEIVVGARVSKSGAASAASGDLEGLSAKLRPSAQQVEVIIDRVVP